MSAMFEVFTAWKLAHTRNHVGFPGGLDGRESTCNAGDLGLICGLGRSPGGGHGNPLQYSCLENPHGQRSLAGYSPRGCKRIRHDWSNWARTHEDSISSLLLKTEIRDRRIEIKPIYFTCQNNLDMPSILITRSIFQLQELAFPIMVFCYHTKQFYTYGERLPHLKRRR